MNIQLMAENRVKELQNKAKESGLFCSDKIKKNYNFEFTLTDGSNSIKILVYFGKKGVRTVVQGSPSSLLYDIALSLTGSEESKSENKSANKDLNYDKYIGSDESGKGDFFGPLVTAAFFCDEGIAEKLNNVGIRDSKTLSDIAIGRLAYKLEQEFSDSFSISVIPPKEYNKRYKLTPNVNTILSEEHSKVIQNLFDKVGKINVITDQFSVRTNIMRENLGEHINFVTKGERYPAVAAASILARNKFNEWFEEEPALTLGLQKGASVAVENHAREIKNNFGLDIFNEIAKIHFATYKKIQS